MPYSTNEQLPSNVRQLSSEAQTLFRTVFNSTFSNEKDEAKSFGAAWSALKEQGLSKSSSMMLYAKSSHIDESTQTVFGWGSVYAINGEAYVDLQDDIIEERELEFAVYDFMTAPKHDEMHKRIITDSTIVESMVVTDEKLRAMFPDQELPIGKRGWWLGVRINDRDVYQKHATGVYTGFSIMGSCSREEVNLGT